MLKIIAVLDQFSYEFLKYDCELINIGTENWKDTIEEMKPDLLFVESAWEGQNKAWQYKIIDLQYNNDHTLDDLVCLCKYYKIPTVFWNKEDPLFFDNFIEAARKFDYVFTTDEGCIKKYQKALQHNNVYLFPFAVQPRIHNPVNKEINKIGNVAFAGTWYGLNPERVQDMEIVLKPAMQHGLHIYDRMHDFNKDIDFLQYPEEYRPYIQGSVPYQIMTSVYKMYPIFLNANLVRDSKTMFSRRVFELLACGTNVISSYSCGIEATFPDIVKLSSNEAETSLHLDNLLKDKDLRDRLSLLGQREVFAKHTARQRLDYVAKKTKLIGNKNSNIHDAGVSIIGLVENETDLNTIVENYKRQNYEKKELILAIHDSKMNIQKIWLPRGSTILRYHNSLSKGKCLNLAIDHASFEYVSMFKSDGYYAPDFIGDLMHTFLYSDSDIVGKLTTFIYFIETHTLAIHIPHQEYLHTHYLKSAAMIVKKKVFDSIHYQDTSTKYDDMFIKECDKKGFKFYSSDRFNYLWIIPSSINFSSFAHECISPTNTDNFVPLITV